MHTQQVMLKLEEVVSLVKDAETGQRGYLLTGEQQYLAPFTQAKGRIGPALDELDKLTADNPEQQPRVATLRQLVQEKLRELEKTIALYGGGNPVEARQIVLSDRGRQLMEQIRATVAEMRNDETQLLQARQRSWALNTQRLLEVIAITTALDLLLLVAVILINHRRLLEERKASAEIRLREERFRTTLTSIGDAVVTTDNHSTVTFVNTVAEKLLNATLAACVGKPLEQVFPIYNEQTGARAENPVEKVITSGKVAGLANHTVLKLADGRVIPIEDSAAPIFDDERTIAGAVLVFRDVSRQRAVDIALRNADRLAVAGRMAATVAHEVNNPLEAVFNLIFLCLASDGLTPESRKFLELADRELRRVSHLTRRTLSFYRNRQETAPVSLATTMDEVLDFFGLRFQARSIVVHREYLTHEPLLGVPGDLGQIVNNLISNAFDALSKGGELWVRTASEKLNGAEAQRLTVHDSGVGISPENLPRIFEPFFTTKSDFGTGLGLWVVKDLVEKHGGVVSVESTPGRGTSFHVVLPMVSPVARTAGVTETPETVPSRG